HEGDGDRGEPPRGLVDGVERGRRAGASEERQDDRRLQDERRGSGETHGNSSKRKEAGLKWNRQVCLDALDYGQTCLYCEGMSNGKLEGSARDRLLAAATELFYAEGVHTVGIDRVIERAGVAKASLYSTFGSKEELVRAYLAGRAEARQRRVSERIARYDH